LYRDLVRQLEPDQPAYGLQSQGLDGHKPLLGNLQEIAKHYIEEIRSLQPEGPYYLGGYCLGGTIAYEKAQQLHRQKQKVALLAMFETYNIKSSPTEPTIQQRVRIFLENIKFHAENMSLLDRKNRVKFLGAKTRTAIRRLQIRLHIECSKLVERLRRDREPQYPHLYIKEFNDKAHREYEPQSYSGSLTLFRPKVNFKGFQDPHFGWRHLVEKCDVHYLPVNPRGMLIGPFAKNLAWELTQCIETATRRTLEKDMQDIDPDESTVYSNADSKPA